MSILPETRRPSEVRDAVPPLLLWTAFLPTARPSFFPPTSLFPTGVSVPCINGFQNFTGYQYPGLITQHPTGTEDFSVAGKWQVRMRRQCRKHSGNLLKQPRSRSRAVESADHCSKAMVCFGCGQMNPHSH